MIKEAELSGQVMGVIATEERKEGNRKRTERTEKEKRQCYGHHSRM